MQTKFDGGKAQKRYGFREKRQKPPHELSQDGLCLGMEICGRMDQ